MNWSSVESSATKMVLRPGIVLFLALRRRPYNAFSSRSCSRVRTIKVGHAARSLHPVRVMQPREENPRAFRVGLDLGGTKTEGIVLDPAGAEVFRKRIDTQAQDGYDAILGRI